MWTNINMHVAGFGIPAVWNGEWPNKNYAFTFHHFTFPSMCETMRTQVFWNPPSGLNGQNLKWHLRFLPGCRVEWTCRCVLSTTAAVTKTAMQRTPGQRPVWTHRCPLWYARIQLQALHETLSALSHLFPSTAAFASTKHDITGLTCATSSPEQAELIAVGPRHGWGGLGPAGWLRRVLAGAAEVAGGGAGGAGSGPTHGPHAGGGGETDPAPQTLTCGRLG